VKRREGYEFILPHTSPANASAGDFVCLEFPGAWDWGFATSPHARGTLTIASHAAPHAPGCGLRKSPVGREGESTTERSRTEAANPPAVRVTSAAFMYSPGPRALGANPGPPLRPQATPGLGETGVFFLSWGLAYRAMHYFLCAGCARPDQAARPENPQPLRGPSLCAVGTTTKAKAFDHVDSCTHNE
jgi:hypothetical protein